MEYRVYRYKRQYAIFATNSRCYILFGTKREMVKRCAELNAGK